MGWGIPDELLTALGYGDSPDARTGAQPSWDAADHIREVIRSESTPENIERLANLATGGGGFAGPIKMGLFTMPKTSQNYVAKEFKNVADAVKAGWKRGMSPYPEIELTPNINPDASELRLKWDDTANRYLTDWVGTRPDYRRQGYAKRLWAQAKDLLGYDPTPEYILQNEMAPKFWEKMGYDQGLRQDTWADDIIREARK